MGSGETAPTMVKPHRQLFDRLGPDPGARRPARHPLRLPGQRRRHLGPGRRVLRRQRGPAGRGRSSCAGSRAPTRSASRPPWPGWRRPAGCSPGRAAPPTPCASGPGTDVPDLLADKLAHGGCVVFASAAALTLGRYTVPVYEVYKVGRRPGLGRRARPARRSLGPDVAVIPHYDNAEGGNHDTRFCYLGERRLADPGGAAARRRVGTGRGRAHRVRVRPRRRHGDRGRQRGRHRAAGRPRRKWSAAATTLPIAELVDLAFGKRTARRRRSRPPPADVRPSARADGPARRDPPAGSRVRRRGGGARRRRRGAGGAGARRHPAWRGRATPPSPTPATGAGPPCGAWWCASASWPAPGPGTPGRWSAAFVDALLAERAAAREDRRFADADRVRDALVSLGVEVRDTPTAPSGRSSRRLDASAGAVLGKVR